VHQYDLISVNDHANRPVTTARLQLVVQEPCGMVAEAPRGGSSVGAGGAGAPPTPIQLLGAHLSSPYNF